MWQPRPIINKWTPDQERVAACFPEHRRLAVPAANGVGKTYLAADLVASFINDMPAAAIILTAPTNRQVCELLWPHVAERLVRLKLAEQDWKFPTQPKWEGGDKDWLVGFATNTPQRMQGYHAQHLLVVIDEAVVSLPSMIEALEGIAVGESNYILAIGNPNEAEGGFYDMTRRPSWHVETMSALNHPNVLERHETIPGATTWTSLVDRIRDWCKPSESAGKDTFSVEISEAELHEGTDSTPRLRFFLPNDAFRIRYLGEFPRAVAWCLIDRDKIYAAMESSFPLKRPKLAAVDVARTGGDRTVYAIREGDNVTCMRVIEAGNLMTQAEELHAWLKEDQPETLNIDAAGLGYGVVDRLRQLEGVIPIIEFLGAEAPLSRAQQKMYLNRRAAAYGNLQDAFRYHRISIPKDLELADELAAIRYRHDSSGKMQIDDKEKIRGVLGRSPDAADVLSLLWESGAACEQIQPVTPVSVVREEKIRW